METEEQRIQKLERLLNLTAQMRRAQKSYFKARREGRDTHPELIVAQRLERDVDHALEPLLAPPEPPQLPMFDDGMPY